MDTDVNTEDEQKTLVNIFIYAIDEHGICHLFDHETFHQVFITPKSIEENTCEDISKLIDILLSQIDSSRQLTNNNLINYNSNDTLSTQPFSIVNFDENNLSFLNLLNKNLSTPVLSPPLQFSGQVMPQYQSQSLIHNENNANHVSKKMKNKKKKNLYNRLRRCNNTLKQRIKTYFNKQKREKQKSNKSHIKNTLSVIVPHESVQIESTSIEHPSMIDFQLMPDLSKRKYIFKDINLSTNNSNQMNWKIFQCTQPSSSSISYADQTVMSDLVYHPSRLINNPLSFTDIRIGLSRHRSIKQLHKIVID